MKCGICGDEVDQTGTRSRRLYHPACKRFRNFLDAAERAAKEIVAEDRTDWGRRIIRRHVFTLANQVGAILQRRDERGRFCC
jgi:hypothetical protein